MNEDSNSFIPLFILDVVLDCSNFPDDDWVASLKVGGIGNDIETNGVVVVLVKLVDCCAQVVLDVSA